jgi:hypothetical protein
MDITTIISIVVSAIAVIIAIACDICIAVNHKKLKKAERKIKSLDIYIKTTKVYMNALEQDYREMIKKIEREAV